MITLDTAGERLVRWIESGVSHAIDWSGESLNADLLRAIMTGMPVKFTGETTERPVRAWGVGVRIKNAVVTGKLDLFAGRSPSGGAMPPLLLSGCLIKEEIILTRANIRFLSLRASRLVHLDGRGIHVEETLDLSSVTSAEAGGSQTGQDNSGTCWIELQDSSIGGQLRAIGAHVVAPVEQINVVKILTSPRFALDLTHAHVGDSVLLGPEVRGSTPHAAKAVGGVSLIGAHVGGDVVCDSAEFTGTLGGAFVADGAQIGGRLTCDVRRLKPDDAPARFTASGDVTLREAKVASGISMTGASIDGHLIASHMVLGGDLRLRASEGDGNETWPPIAFRTTQETDLHASRISGDLELDGSTFEDGLVARDVQVSCDVRVCHLGADKFRSMPEGWDTWPALKWLLYLEIRNYVRAGKAVFSWIQSLTHFRHASRRDLNDPIRLCFAASRIIDLSKASIMGSLKVEIRDKHYRDHYRRDPQHRPIFDLRFAHVGVLADDDGDGFGKDYQLKINEIKYDVLHRTEGHKNAFQMGVWFWSIYWILLLSVSYSTYRHTTIFSCFVLVACICYGPFGYHLFQTIAFCAASYDRRRWLKLQYRTRKATAWEFAPEPYHALSRYFHSIGLISDARNVASWRHSLELKFSTRFILKPFVWLYGFFFRYGLSPARSIATFCAFVAIGYIGITVEKTGLDIPEISFPLRTDWVSAFGISAGRSFPGTRLPHSITLGGSHLDSVLVVETETVNSAITKITDHGTTTTLPAILNPSNGTNSDEIPCGDQIDPLLYATDLFVPAIDLNQEHKCRVSAEQKGAVWRRANTAYKIIGWIVTALTVLTASGLLRRQSETE